MNRKDFLKTSIYLGAGLSFIGCLSDKTQTGVAESSWKDGDVAHILPTVNHNRMLVSTSYKRVVKSPVLKVGNQTFKGQMRDSQGYFWAYDCQNLQANTQYDLQLLEDNTPLCDAWQLKTFPKPNEDTAHLKLMMFTCAGGHPVAQDFIPVPETEKEPAAHFAEKRVRLLNRGLSFKPDAMVVIGDTVYWDLHGNGKGRLGTSVDPRAIEIGGKFEETKSVLGTKNEEILKKIVSPQIIDLYGTACRSTPVFFFNDDHDYFENDEANDVLVTFPPKPFNLELSRTVQRMYFPEFLPDANRPQDLPGSSAVDRVAGSSEAFGTLRYGKLAELLMYDCRRFINLNGAAATFIPSSTENWLINRTQSQDVKHTIQVPSTPYGWSAGKWLEWYPDVLGKDKKLHDDLPKYLWQKGWQSQHDRLLKAMHDTKFKKPIVISGDIHTFASGKIHRNGNLDFSDNPIHSYIAGTLGCTVFPSTFRKVKTAIPNVIGMEEEFENVEENGFSIVDIDQRNVHIKMYNYLWSRDDLKVIDDLKAFKNLTT